MLPSSILAAAGMCSSARAPWHHSSGLTSGGEMSIGGNSTTSRLVILDAKVGYQRWNGQEWHRRFADPRQERQKISGGSPAARDTREFEAEARPGAASVPAHSPLRVSEGPAPGSGVLDRISESQMRHCLFSSRPSVDSSAGPGPKNCDTWPEPC